MSIEVHPILKGLAEHLLAEAEVDSRGSTSRVHVGHLPTKRARRLFEHFLLDAAEQRGVMLVPPEISTPGRMIDQFVRPTGLPASPVALELVDRQVWMDLDPSQKIVEGSNATGKPDGMPWFDEWLSCMQTHVKRWWILKNILEMIPEGVAGGEERAPLGRAALVLAKSAGPRGWKHSGCNAHNASGCSRLFNDVSQGLYSRVVLVDGESSPFAWPFLRHWINWVCHRSCGPRRDAS